MFQGLRLFFLTNFLGSTVIPCPTSIPDSRVEMVWNIGHHLWETLSNFCFLLLSAKKIWVTSFKDNIMSSKLTLELQLLMVLLITFIFQALYTICSSKQLLNSSNLSSSLKPISLFNFFHQFPPQMVNIDTNWLSN